MPHRLVGNEVRSVPRSPNPGLDWCHARSVTPFTLGVVSTGLLVLDRRHTLLNEGGVKMHSAHVSSNGIAACSDVPFPSKLEM